MKDNGKPPPSLPVVTRFWCSKVFSPTIEETVLGKYRIRPIPKEASIRSPVGQELLLFYVDRWKEGQQNSNPVEESGYVLAWLSVLLKARIEYRASKINDVDIDLRVRSRYEDFVSTLEALPAELSDLYSKLLSLDENLLCQYVRSCLVYQNAVSALESSPTLAFFLLVVAIECLSNTVVPRGGNRDRFVQFIKSHVPTDNEALFARLLGQAYKYRSAFTHGGSAIPEACLMADQAGYSYIKHYLDGRETYSPGIGWLERVVNAALIEFLRRQRVVLKPDADLSDLARQQGIVILKTKKAVESGALATDENVEVQ